MLGDVNTLALLSMLLLSTPPCERWEVRLVPMSGSAQLAPKGWEPIGTRGGELVLRRCASRPSPGLLPSAAVLTARRRAAAGPTSSATRLSLARWTPTQVDHRQTRFPFRPPGVRARTMEALSAHLGARIVIRSTVGRFRGTLAAVRPRSVVTRLRDGSRRRWTLSELISIRLHDGP